MDYKKKKSELEQKVQNIQNQITNLATEKERLIGEYRLLGELEKETETKKK